jgi:hypothetical protein
VEAGRTVKLAVTHVVPNQLEKEEHTRSTPVQAQSGTSLA